MGGGICCWWMQIKEVVLRRLDLRNTIDKQGRLGISMCFPINTQSTESTLRKY